MSAPRQWTTSSHSGSGGQCVEVRSEHGTVAIRDTKNRTAATLTITAEQWTRFLTQR